MLGKNPSWCNPSHGGSLTVLDPSMAELGNIPRRWVTACVKWFEGGYSKITVEVGVLSATWLFMRLEAQPIMDIMVEQKSIIQ